MAYFDSVKNRVLWQKELDRLRTERDRRARGESPQQKKQAAGEKVNSFRQRITFEQLEQEARGEKQSSLSRDSRSRTTEREKSRTVQRERTL